ncbi:MAG: methyltransferase domain-containing protein [Phycisphaerales bacterium]|nr:methyltransferase domain-containing protein [Phycisphaerales bacterium]
MVEWDVSEMVRCCQQACVIMAAAELELFDRMNGPPFTAKEAARALGADLRATAALLDALAAIEVIRKVGERYRIPAAVKAALTAQGTRSVLAMTQHQATCLRRWSHLAEVVKTGRPAPREAGIRGAKADYAAFIEAMDNIGRSTAPKLVAELQPLKFRHLLDVGGASGTYTIAFLRANRQARATIFDLPQVLPQAKERLSEAGMSRRVELVAGDFYVDRLPQGADLVWLSAIVHQNSRQQNRVLFENIFRALVSGGQVLIRDFLMDSSRTVSVAGALFAINMLVATPKGGTFTVNELRDDLAAAGFTRFGVLKQDGTMQSVVAAKKP